MSLMIRLRLHLPGLLVSFLRMTATRPMGVEGWSSSSTGSIRVGLYCSIRIFGSDCFTFPSGIGCTLGVSFLGIGRDDGRGLTSSVLSGLIWASIPGLEDNMNSFISGLGPDLGSKTALNLAKNSPTSINCIREVSGLERFSRVAW